MVCLALELVGPWVVLGFSVGMEAFDELLSINVSWIQEFSDVLRIWTYASLLLVFSFIFTVVSRCLHLYSTDDKTSRLKMKSFPTLRDTQRVSLFLKTMICFSGCLMSSASIQKLFCRIYSVLKCSFDEFVGEKVVSPSYSSAILGLPLEFQL